MNNQNKVLAHVSKYAVTYLFIALSVSFIIVSGLDINYVASQLLLRLNRNAFIVLALIIPIIAGMGINFAITIGAMAAQIGLLLTISWGVSGMPGILLCLLAGGIAGGFWAAIPGLLKIYRGQNEMIISIMLNYVATLFMGVVYTNWLREGSVPQTMSVPDEVKLTRLFGLRCTSAFVIAVVIGLLIYYFLFYTSMGFQLRAVGLNMTASQFNGFSVKKYILFSFILSGVIAGVGGSAELLGTQFRLINGFGAGYGFDGVAMALIAQLHPLAAILVAIFFAALRVGSTTMQAATGVPTSVSEIIQALVIVFTVAGLALVKLPEFKAFLERLFPARKEA